MMNTEISISESVYSDIKQLLIIARQKSISVVNTAMVQTYWQIGKIIVDAQGGEVRATYGDELLARISKRLTEEFGKGFTARNLRNMRQFYLCFPNWHTVRANLSWSHIRQLISVSNVRAREFYAEQAAAEGWSTRELERQIATQFYERLLSTQRDEAEINSLVRANIPANPDKFDPLSFVHDPFILEFLDVSPMRLYGSLNLKAQSFLISKNFFLNSVVVSRLWAVKNELQLMDSIFIRTSFSTILLPEVT